jgi:pimeloyl-ACP methyl ester carboxylesterase
MCYRGAGPLDALAAALRDRFTVYTYDRRGRGESGDTLPYAVAREVEDLRAIVARAGGAAGVYGISSGAALALATAAVEPGITRLALYEPPFLAEVEDEVLIKEYSEQLDALLDAGRRGDAVVLFMTRVGVPEPVIAGMRAQPGWARMEAIAPTLGYDDRVLGDGRVPRELAPAITVPTLLLAGDASPQRLRLSARAAADAFPTAEFRVLEGQTHDVSPEALAPVLAGFFSA